MKTVSRCFLLLFLASLAAPAHAYFQLELMNSKRTARQSSQWTLADWLSQKGRMSLMDQWLAMNKSANIFEFNPSAAHGRYTLKTADATATTSVDQDFQAYALDIYVTIFNLYGEYEKTSAQREAYGGAVGFRLLGTSSQTTNLVARYGWRQTMELQTQEEWENRFAEGQLQLYILKSFGLQGRYRYYFPSDSNLGQRLEGHRVSGGAFIDLFVMRIFGDYFQEPLELTSNGSVTKVERQGYEAGVRFYF